MTQVFRDFAQPPTIAALLVEAALASLALAAASGRLVRLARWLARGLTTVTLLLGLGFATGMLLEIRTSPLPFVVPEAPLGTFARMTQLGLLVSAFTFGVAAVGSALAFRRPDLGGALLVASGLLGLLDSLRQRLQDATLPPDSFIVGLVLALLILVVGALVLATWWAERRGERRTGRPSATVPGQSPAAP